MGKVSWKEKSSPYIILSLQEEGGSYTTCLFSQEENKETVVFICNLGF